MTTWWHKMIQDCRSLCDIVVVVVLLSVCVCVCLFVCVCVRVCHTPSTAFQHLPPNSARLSYATEEALFISTDAVSALRKVRVLI